MVLVSWPCLNLEGLAQHLARLKDSNHDWYYGLDGLAHAHLARHYVGVKDREEQRCNCSVKKTKVGLEDDASEG